MVENENDPLIGLGGGTGLMDLSMSSDALSTENFLPPDHGAGRGTPPALTIGGSSANADRAAVNAPPSLWRMVHSALRGRYILVITAGVIFGGMLGAVAWRKTRPSFSSDGLVRIAYSLPQVREETDQNQPLPMFETFMQNQKTMITSHRVIEKAVNDPIWAANHRIAPANPDQYFADNLAVEIKARSELIRITVTDPDPRMAAYGVTSIVNAYADLYNSQENQLEQQRLGLLVARQQDLSKQIDTLTEKIRVKAADYGTTRLDSFYDAIALRRAKLESAMTDIHMAIAGAATQPSAGKSSFPSMAEQPGELSVEQIAAVDPVMRSYWSDQERLQAEMDRLAVSYGPAHRVMVAARQDLDSAKLRTKEYANLYRQTHTTIPSGSDPSGSTTVNTNRPLDSLWTTERSLSSLLENTKQEMVTVGNTKLDLDQMQTDLEATRTELAALNHRIEVLRGEGALGGRLSVISAGEVSLQPSSNHRSQMVSAAAISGALMPAAAVFLLTLVRRRYRYSDDAAHDGALRNVPMLGMLPEIRAGAQNYGQMIAAGYGVHHLRVLLGSRIKKGGKRTYLVTSATEGEGKTSLAVALAVSFAAAKQRVLVIDGDFVGRKTTQGFRAQNQDGLYESLEERNIGDRVIQATPFLHVLPAGRATPADACSITTGGIRQALEQLKGFDIVLIDSGPILESLEAGVLAQEVDGVILAISRGQQSDLVAQAVHRFQALGARLVGAVFNRANSQDFQCAAEPSPKLPLAGKGALVEMSELQRSVTNFGPVVRAVAMTISASS